VGSQSDIVDNKTLVEEKEKPYSDYSQAEEDREEEKGDQRQEILSEGKGTDKRRQRKAVEAHAHVKQEVVVELSQGD
jgi:hypothetical protein